MMSSKLLALHRSLQRLIYEYGKLDPREVDISFDMPTREAIDRLTRPTICLYLHSIQESFDVRQSNIGTVPASNGHILRQWHFRPFSLHYMVTALTTDIEDVYQLVWRTLEALVRNPQIPSELLDEELAHVTPPPQGSILQDMEAQNLSGIWSSLSLPHYPSFSYAVAVPVSMDLLEEVPLVLKSTVRIVNLGTKREVVEAFRHVGGRVQNPEGVPLAGVKITLANSTREYRTDDAGQFVIPHVPAGPLQLFVAHEPAEPQSVSVEISDESATNLTIVLHANTKSEV